jgi:pyruvate dehydrogenase E2 component (dihydrolipoamide acetyltransferase)
MSTPVVMPQMGESIAEGTIVRWMKKVGDAVDRDEPLFEISTDKVDAEIPSPAAGVLTEIKVLEGETVPVNSVVATIGDGTDVATPPASASAGGAAKASPAPAKAGHSERQGDGDPAPPASTPPPRQSRPAPEPPPRPAARAQATRPVPGSNGHESEEMSVDDLRRQKSSPLVRRIAKEHNVDIDRIHGTGIGGRVTKQDILDYIDSGTDAPRPEVQDHDVPAPQDTRGRTERRPVEPRSQSPEPGDEIRPLSVMRKKIAEHMILSRRTSAHVHSVFHVNFSAVDKIRQQKKADYERSGAKLTFMSFIAKAVIDALRRHPIVNASIDGDNVVYKKDINIGIAVALETGLIVPVIRHADEKNMLGLSRAIADIAERARAKQLKPEDVQGGTFTITNPGQFGAQFGMPIINQPQSAILGIGTIEKRPIVVDDAIAIRTMSYLTLGFDHRLIDGAVADQFMADVKERIERFDISQV